VAAGKGSFVGLADWPDLVDLWVRGVCRDSNHLGVGKHDDGRPVFSDQVDVPLDKTPGDRGGGLQVGFTKTARDEACLRGSQGALATSSIKGAVAEATTWRE
jgi:hypothetical protein